MHRTKIRKVLNVYYVFDFLSLLFVAFESHLEQNRKKIELQKFLQCLKFERENDNFSKLTDEV